VRLAGSLVIYFQKISTAYVTVKIKKVVYDMSDFILFSALPAYPYTASWQQLMDMDGYSVLGWGVLHSGAVG
jgi:hypothetical protein